MIDFAIKDIIDILLVGLLLFYLYRTMKKSGRLNKFIGVLAFVVGGCAGGEATDSAKCLSLIDSAWTHLSDNEFAEAVTGYSDACTMAEKSGLDNEWFQARVGLARCYYRMGNNPEAYFLLSQAYEFAKKKLDEKWQYFALGNMALIDLEQGEWGIAKKYFSEINDWAEQNNNKVLQSNALGNLAELYGKTGDYRQALRYVERARALVPADKQSLAAQLQAVRVSVLCDSGAYAAAAVQCDTLTRMIGSDVSLREEARLYRTRILFATGAEEAALDSASLILRSSDPLMLIETRDLLALQAEKRGDYRQSLEHTRVGAALRDSLSDVKLGATNKANVARLDLHEARAQIEGKDRVIVWESIAIGLMCVLAVVGLLLTCHLIRNHRVRREQAERERRETEQQLQDSIKAGDTLKGEIDSKNRTLASKMMHITRRGEIVEDFMRFLSDNPQGSSDPEYKRRLMQFKAELKNSEDLESSMTYFENVNSGFLTRLRQKHPELNSNDIRFLCYVYMQLNTKEIASLLNIAESSCKKRKQRLSAKMHLANAGELYSYISEI